MYDYKNPTKYSEAECEAVVGERATLHLTGTIVDHRVSPNGPFVLFEIDERWGLGRFRFGVDLDALKLERLPAALLKASPS